MVCVVKMGVVLNLGFFNLSEPEIMNYILGIRDNYLDRFEGTKS